MQTSGTFISDLKKEILNTELFIGLMSVGKRDGAIGDIVLVLSDSLLDYILAAIDVEKAKDFPDLADAIGRRHVSIMAHIVTCCKPS